MTCRICNDIDSYEDEDHLLVCKTLNSEEYDVRYSDGYQNVDKQYKVTSCLKKFEEEEISTWKQWITNPSVMMDQCIF
jgi:hypothetical protein